MSDADGGAPPQASSGWRAASLLWSGGCALVIMLCIAAVAGPKLISARAHGNESAAIGALRQLGNAQAQYRERTGRFGTLAELAEVELIDPVLGAGEQQGYRFACGPGQEPAFLWWATANPIRPGGSGDRYFATSHFGVVYYALDAPVAIDPRTGEVPEGVNAVGR